MITKEEWRSGEYRAKPEFKSQEGYYKAVSEFVKTYGEPTKEDMLVVRSGQYKEFQTGRYGASWNPNINNARVCAKMYFAPYIYVMFVPKGTMAVHYEQGEGEGWSSLEEEYVFDMAGMGVNKRSGKVHIIAEHSGDWDKSSDYETIQDIQRWQLLNVPSLNNLDGKIWNNFFGEEEEAA